MEIATAIRLHHTGAISLLTSARNGNRLINENGYWFIDRYYVYTSQKGEVHERKSCKKQNLPAVCRPKPVHSLHKTLSKQYLYMLTQKQ